MLVIHFGQKYFCNLYKIPFSKKLFEILVSNVTIDNWNAWDITDSVTNPAKKTFWNAAVECNISYLSNGREAL